MSMTVKELREQLKQYPDHMLVKVLTNDGNGHCHEDPTLAVMTRYIQSNSTMTGWNYNEVEVPTLEIS